MYAPAGNYFIHIGIMGHTRISFMCDISYIACITWNRSPVHAVWCVFVCVYCLNGVLLGRCDAQRHRCENEDPQHRTPNAKTHKTNRILRDCAFALHHHPRSHRRPPLTHSLTVYDVTYIMYATAKPLLLYIPTYDISTQNCTHLFALS